MPLQVALPAGHVPIPLELDVLKAACLLPSVLKRLEDNLLALEVKDILGLEQLQVDLLMEALTLESAELPLTMHRLEFLGDAFLNLMVGFIALLNHEDVPIRHNHHASNKCLSDLVAKLGIHHRLIGAPLDQYWHPPSLSRRSQRFSCIAKNVADVLEAILGAAVLSGGEALGIRCLISFGLWPENVSTWPCLLHSLQRSMPHLSSPQADSVALPPLEAVVGYRFSNKTDAAGMLLDTKDGPVHFDELGGLLFNYVATRFLVAQLPLVSSYFISCQLAHFSDPKFYQESPRIREIIRWFENASGQCETTLQSGQAPLELVVIHRLLRAIFVDTRLNFPSLHRIFYTVYSPIALTRIYSLDSPKSFKLFVARAFFLARCRSMKIKYSLDYSKFYICSLLIHENAAVIKRAKSEYAAQNQALSAFLKLLTQPGFIEARCTCRQPAEAVSPESNWLS